MKGPFNNTHNIAFGYILWIFGFTGSHRFYYGRPISGTLYFCTFGLLGVGWIVDLFLIPGMDKAADIKYREGTLDYTLAWILLTFLGLFGVHRLYMGKWVTGLLYFFSGGFFTLGIIYDFWTLNQQIDQLNVQYRDASNRPFWMNP